MKLCCIVLVVVCFTPHIYIYGLRSCSAVLTYASLILPQYVTHGHRCDENRYVWNTVISAWWCSFVFLCVSMYVFEFVFVSLRVPVYLIEYLPWHKAAGKTQIKRKQRNGTETEQRGKMRESQRERERESQFQFSCDFQDEMNVRSHNLVHTLAHAHTNTC